MNDDQDNDEDDDFLTAGFLITVAPWRFCLTTQSQVIILGRCDVTNPAYQWAWTGGGRLVHTQSSRCLWANGSPQLPPHTRLTKLSACSRAPGWSCTEGALGLAETHHMYLKTMGSRVVVEGTLQASGWRGSGWRRFDVDYEGNELLTSLCPDTDSAHFYSSTRELQQRPATTESTHNHIVRRCVTARNITDSHVTDSHVTDSHVTDSHVIDSHVTDSHVTDSHVTDSNIIHAMDSHVTDSHVTDSNVIHAMDSYVTAPPVTASNVIHVMDSHVMDSHVTDSHVTDSHVTDSHVTDSNVIDSHVTDSHVTDSNVMDSHVTDSHVTDSHVTDSNVMDSHVTDSHVTDSHVTDSNVMDSHVTDSHVTDSHVTDSHVTDSNVIDSYVTAPAVTDSHVTDSHVTASHVMDSHVTDLNVTDSHVMDSHVMDSHVMDSHVTDSDVTASHATASHVTNSHVTDSHATASHVTNSHVTDSHATASHVTNSHVTDLHVTASHATDSQVTDTHVTYSQVTNSLVTDSHSTDSNVIDSQVTNSQVTDSQVTDTHVTDSHATDSQVTDPQVTNSLVTDTHVTDSHATDCQVTDPQVTNSLVTDSHSTDSNVPDSQVTNSQVTDSHSTDSQVTDSQVTDSHATDSHVTDSQVTNSQVIDSNVTDSQVTDSHSTDSQVTDSQVTDSHATESHATDSHVSDSVTSRAWTDVVPEVSQTRRSVTGLTSEVSTSVAAMSSSNGRTEVTTETTTGTSQSPSWTNVPDRGTDASTSFTGLTFNYDDTTEAPSRQQASTSTMEMHSPAMPTFSQNAPGVTFMLETESSASSTPTDMSALPTSPTSASITTSDPMVPPTSPTNTRIATATSVTTETMMTTIQTMHVTTSVSMETIHTKPPTITRATAIMTTRPITTELSSAPPTVSRCSVIVSEVGSGSHWAELGLTTGGVSCNFSVVNGEESSDCDAFGENDFLCRLEDLEPGTLYELTVISRKDGEKSNKSVRTEPVGPARLEVRLDQVPDGSLGLTVMWSRSAGHVDWYDVSLEDSSSGSRTRTRILDSAVPRSGFSSLLPGSLYAVSVVATAGNKSAAPVVTTATTAPSSVRGLQVASSSLHSLGVSWRAGPGRTEQFVVLLTDQDEVLLKNVSLHNTETSAEMDGLQPGTRYTVSVVTQAVGLQSSASIQAVTVPAAVTRLTLDNNSSCVTLLASWRSPVGGVDLYLLTLSALGSAVQQRRLPPDVTRVVFGGLTPGRSYQLSIKSTAGGQSTETGTRGRTVPRPVSSLSMSPLGDGRSLRLNWAPPSGDWENYSVLLWNDSVVLVNVTVNKLSVQFVFSVPGLVPGRLYRAEVTVQSGVMVNTAFCYGQLAPRPVQQLLVRHVDQTSLSVLWTPPIGQWEGFTVLVREADSASEVAQRLLPWDSTECTFILLTSGRRYTVTVKTNSRNLSSSASVTARTAPAQVGVLRLSNLGTIDSLQALWERAYGDLDSYRLLLVHDTSVIKNESVDANSTAVTFHALRAGALYRVVLTTVRAGHASRQTVAEGRTVPAAVGEVTVSNNGRTDFLSVSWRPAAGEVDSYLVTLRDREKPVHTLAVSKSSPECVFNSLVSGRLYNISISSRSGNYLNHTFVQERTQPSKVQNPTASHAARDDYLRIYWRHAAGDLDQYQVFIKHNNVFLQNQTVLKTQNECVFNHLVPGRLYTVLVNTRSGKYETSTSTHGRTFPAGVRFLALAAGGSEELRVRWSAALGDVDHYEVQLLFNDMKVFPPITLGSSVGECVLSALTPGRLYKILVSTFSGPNQRAQFIEGRTVPSTVKNIHVSNTGDSSSLQVSWTPGEGDVDKFSVFLFRDRRQLDVRCVLKHQNQMTFGSLQPGQTYDVTVQSVSGELVNNITASGRTVPSAVTGLQVENLHTTCILQVSWQEALGVADGYILQVLDDRGFLVSNSSQDAACTSYRFHSLIPGKKYRVLVQTTSGGVRSPAVSAESRTRPAAVTDLSIMSNTTTSLSFHWSPPEGDFELYEILFYQGDESLQERQRVQSSSQQCAFHGLTPGTPYRVVVLTHSGDQSNQTSIWARTVPAAVVSLTTRTGNQSDELLVTWTRGPGDLSGLLLSLYDPSGSRRAAQHLGSEVTEYVFSHLVPGRLYRAEVLSLSGDLSNRASAAGRTAPRPPTSFLFGGVTNTSLEITWSGPAGSDYDDFDLQWTPGDQLSVINPYHSRTSGSRLLRSMFPGRLYTFILRTVSGATGPGATPTLSTPIQYSIRTKPERVPSLHCRPQSSTSISCSWAPPVADYDSYTVECLRHDSQKLVYSRRTGRNSTTYIIPQLEPYKRYTVSVRVISDTTTSEEAEDSVVTMIDSPPAPPLSVRVSDKSAVVTRSSIVFTFNCSWFSDVNGAIRFFTVVVTESEGLDNVQPQQQHPLPSYLDYRSNSSIKSYQTSYFPSPCTQGPVEHHSLQISLGMGMDSLGGTCDPEASRNLIHFCDGPLKPQTSYRQTEGDRHEGAGSHGLWTDVTDHVCVLQTQCSSFHSSVRRREERLQRLVSSVR
ncbi:receptor-type tyrosine-protein phosphatase beta-like isoform X2 [Platichthys flesus]|uniref:receptor-type tyrosine-protein phosphatase beta-like isoform X2 n=1 Tax=Platichthys flesus TaxID=8260 RepID=UPI002DB7B952|nr:receptor-type tyrosine-protein phosphatase beta-like isoform X2 [Platichthys flesus]